MGNAFYDSSAFIAITGQVATTQFDSGALLWLSRNTFVGSYRFLISSRLSHVASGYARRIWSGPSAPRKFTHAP